ncbi:hypothetical protein RDI58_029184 [Solanum bulbocastanum]|uniref:Uncharacterized protein n=1 Tax=Solanum bulbocastanum TaxID=147425 RepID=A0AAN8SRE9_SOLBU
MQRTNNSISTLQHFKYKLIRIEKANCRLTAYVEFFITMKLLNVIVGTVVETFQIYAGRSMCRRHFKRVFYCVPKTRVSKKRFTIYYLFDDFG